MIKNVTAEPQNDQIIPLLRDALKPRVAIGHALIDNCTAQQACVSIISHAKNDGRPSLVATPNAQHVVLLEASTQLREVYKRADLVIPDGMSLLYAAQFFGQPLLERVPGSTLFEDLCGKAAEQGLRVFLLGGLPGSAELAGAKLKQRYPTLEYTTYCPPFQFERDEILLREAADAVTSAKPHLLFVALGAPKQEQWIYQHGLKLGVPVSMGVGGSFEMTAGRVSRAPSWIQTLGLEWLYRLCLEPKRLWRRYLIGNLEFAAIVIRQRWKESHLTRSLQP